MLDPLDFQDRPAVNKLQRKRRFTALVLLSEQLAARLWRLSCWLALFAGLWMMRIPDLFGGAGPVIALLVFGGGVFYLIRKDVRGLRLPRRGEIDRRLERESGLAHRPIAALEDRLANPQKEPTRKLWGENRHAALETLDGLKRPLPRAVLAAADPGALRFAAILILIAGLVVAGPQWQSRLAAGLFPFTIGDYVPNRDHVTLWITPPEYTRMAEITLQGVGKLDEQLVVPEGSTLKARVAGSGWFTPQLHMGGDTYQFEAFDDKSWGLEMPVTSGQTLILHQWPFTRLEIAYDYRIDQPPEIMLNGEPIMLSKGQMQIPLRVKDDYGVTDIHMSMQLDPMIEDPPLGAPVEDRRAVMSLPDTETPVEPIYDLAWHPWAGLPVVLSFTAEDQKNHSTALPPIKMTLPERIFEHPVAQKLIAMRKRLIWTPEEAAANVSHELEALLPEPVLVLNDPVAFMAVRSAASRLHYNQNDRESIKTVISLLWDTALRIEDGNLSLAARNLRDAQQKLSQLLADPDSSEDQIAEAMNELRHAMAEYFQELARELQKRMADGQAMPEIPSEMLLGDISPQDLAAFLDQMMDQAMSGDRDAARQMLSQLENLMNALDPAMNFQLPPDMEFMNEGISELQQLIESQQALLDQTLEYIGPPPSSGRELTMEYPDFMPLDPDVLEQLGLGDMPPPQQPEQQEQRQDPADQPDYQTGHHKVEQDALRYILGQLMMESDEILGEIPENMQSAEQEMRGSAGQLGDNDPEGSVPHQEQAIADLQQAMEDMQQQLQQRMQQMQIMSFGGSGHFDPLGRPMGEGRGQNRLPSSRVEVPDEAERKRVQEILRTLRERSGQLERPDYELEYFRRLMRQF